MPLVGEGDVFFVEVAGVGRHPVIVVSAQALIAQSSEVVVALVTTQIRGYRVEVPIEGHGLRESVVRCDNLFTIRKENLGERLGVLDLTELVAVRAAVARALGIEG